MRSRLIVVTAVVLFGLACGLPRPETPVEQQDVEIIIEESLIKELAEDKPWYNHRTFGPPCSPAHERHRDEPFIASPTTFNQIVNEVVVFNAAWEYVCTNRMWDMNDRLASFMHGHDLSIEGASFIARERALINVGVYNLAEQESAARYWEESGKAREVVRDHLKSPENLKREYERFKPHLLKALRNAPERDVVTSYLASVLPYFTESVPANVMNALDAHLQAEERTERENWSEDSMVEADKRLAELIAVTPDYRVLQWMLRRKAEGGDELVKAWGEILTNLHQSI